MILFNFKLKIPDNSKLNELSEKRIEHLKYLALCEYDRFDLFDESSLLFLVSSEDYAYTTNSNSVRSYDEEVIFNENNLVFLASIDLATGYIKGKNSIEDYLDSIELINDIPDELRDIKAYVECVDNYDACSTDVNISWNVDEHKEIICMTNDNDLLNKEYENLL